MPLRPKFIQQIRDKALDKLKNYVEPAISTGLSTDPPESEKVEQSFSDRIKNKVKETVSGMSVVQRRLLDPNMPLDMPLIKYRIHYAGERRLLLYMLYNNHWRHVEPMSYRARGKNRSLLFYGHCRAHDETHSFKLGKIKGLVVTDIPFNPRFPIEV